YIPYGEVAGIGGAVRGGNLLLCPSAIGAKQAGHGPVDRQASGERGDSLDDVPVAEAVKARAHTRQNRRATELEQVECITSAAPSQPHPETSECHSKCGTYVGEEPY